MSEYFKQFVVRTLLGVPSTICSLAIVQAIHHWGYRPDQIIAGWIMGAPSLFATELARWTLLILLSVAIWAIADFLLYRRRKLKTAGGRMLLWIGLVASIALAIGFAIALWIGRDHPAKIASAQPSVAEPARERPIIERISNRDVALLKPPFHYNFEWHPDGDNLQIITNITHVPAREIKPDTRIPVFYVKNLNKDFLRTVQLTWMFNDYQSLAEKIESKHLLKYNARIKHGPSGGELHLEKREGGFVRSAMQSFQGSEVHEIEFIDPGGSVQVCPDRVYSAAEIFLLKKLAGARMGTIVRTSMLCRIDGERLEPAIFNVHITAKSSRSFSALNGVPQDYGSDAEAFLEFRIERI